LTADVINVEVWDESSNPSVRIVMEIKSHKEKNYSLSSLRRECPMVIAL
jgi:DNA gyrase/topoisomerase IV subunit A